MKKISVIFCIIFALIFVCCIGYLVLDYSGAHSWENDMNTVRQEVVDNGSDNSTKSDNKSSDKTEEKYIDPMRRKIDFDVLKRKSNDVRSWLYIPDTNIDYYVMQERTKGQTYYLWRNIYGYKNSYGSLFVPAVSNNAEDMHTIIYGHNFSSGWQVAFTVLNKFKDKNYAVKRPYAYQYFPDRVERWKLCYVVSSDESDDIYKSPYLPESDAYEKLISDISNKALHCFDSFPSSDTHMLVLSTCVYHNSLKRTYLVYKPDIAYYYDKNIEVDIK